MSRFFRIALASLLLLVPTLAVADTAGEIRAALDYYAEMWNDNDIDAVTGYYHQDFVLITPEGPVSVTERLEDLKVILAQDSDQGELTHTQVKVRELGEKHALAYGELSLKFKDGSSIKNWFSTTYVKTPFGWKALLTYN